MPEVRYTVPGVPAGPANGLSAFTPHFQPQAASGAQAYKYGVTIYAGMVRVPAPTVNTQISADGGDRANAGTSRSSDAPQAWWPGKAYQGIIAERPGAGMPVATPDNGDTLAWRDLLPAPAGSVAGVLRRDSARLSRRAILNRVRQLPWYPRIQSFPPAGGAGNG
jgi:hypothetical protein